MPSFADAVSANASWQPSYNEPVGVFIGGTSGVGQGMAELFAKMTNGKAHIILVGRNRSAAERIFATMPTAASEGSVTWKREFFQCDVSLMKNVKALSHTLLEQLPKINFLVLSAGAVNFGGRDETEEGIDKMLALRYYSRWKFIYELMPLLRKAKDAGEDARVMSVHGSGFFKPKPTDLSDLAMKKNYSGPRAILRSAVYNDYMAEVHFFLLSPPF